MRSAVRVILTLLLAAAPWASVQAQDYPAKPVRIILPFTAGGPTDVLARLMVERMQASLGQPLVIENRPGGGTLIGMEAVARAAPDGYTLGYLTSIPYTAVELSPPAWDIQRDLAAVARFADFLPQIMVTNTSIPARTVPQLIAYAKANPGTVSVGYTGFGAPAHVIGEVMVRRAGIPLTLVSYKGGIDALNDFQAGRINLLFALTSSIAESVKAGKVFPLAAVGEERHPQMPEVPTLAEVGLPDISLPNWSGFNAPAGVPGAVVAKLERAVEAALASPQMNERMSALAVKAAYQNAATFGAQVRRDAARIRKLVDDSGIREQAKRDAGSPR